MTWINGMLGAIRRAIVRARIPILTVAVTNLIGVLIGIGMVSSGNEFALSYRDGLVANAHASDPASLALSRGDSLNAAFIDFGRNLFLGAIPNTVGGVSVIVPYLVSAYHGWVGGVVSVDGNRLSRFANPFEAIYYVSVLILQLTPYSLASGAGVNLGWAYLRPRVEYPGAKWYGIPIEAIRDVGRVYLLVVPLFFVASLWEFLSPWN